VKQSEKDNVYNVDGIDIIVPKELEYSLKGAKIGYGGFIFKDFFVTPKYS